MLSRLSPKDLEYIRSYIKEYAYSEGADICADMADTSYILRLWAKNKEEILKSMFGDKLILEKEIEFTRSETQIRNEIYQELEYTDGEMREFYQNYQNALVREFGMWTDPYYYCRNIISARSLASNTVQDVYDTNTVLFHTGNKVTITPGAKVMRTLGKICKELHMEEEFERFRLKHSLCLNQKSLKGTLCLSIHPLDYITMSDNDNGWSSCMSWTDDGDYRGGTVEMMNSPYVIVAYLKSQDKTLKWPGDHEWNSKLWRTLIIVHPSVIATVKSYPYQNEYLSKTAVEWVRELAINNTDLDFYSKCQEVIHCGITTDPEGYNHRFEFFTNRMYNDCGCVEQYSYIGTDAEDFKQITYSGPSECVICGDTDVGFYDGNFVICDKCCDSDRYGYIDCEECGYSTNPDEIYWVEDTALCYDCFHRLASECALSGDYYFTDNLNTVYLARTPDKPDPNNDAYICIADEYLNPSRYQLPYWLSSYCSEAPKKDENTSVLYWNVSDWNERGLSQYWCLNDTEDVADYIRKAS